MAYYAEFVSFDTVLGHPGGRNECFAFLRCLIRHEKRMTL